jgi:acyl carrier protein
MLESNIKRVFSELFCIDQEEIHDDSSPESVALWDSLNHLRMVTEMEKVFQVRFTMKEIRSMITFGKIQEVLRFHLDGRNIPQQEQEIESI